MFMPSYRERPTEASSSMRPRTGTPAAANAAESGRDVISFRLVKREDVNIVKLEHRIGVELVRISNIPLLRVWIPVSRIHDTTNRTCRQLSWRRWNRRRWINAKTPVLQQLVCAWHQIAAGDTKHAHKDCGILL